MTENEIKEKAQKAEKDLFDAIKCFFQFYPHGCFTAGQIIERLGLKRIGDKNWLVHGYLSALEKEDFLIKMHDKKGFKLK